MLSLFLPESFIGKIRKIIAPFPEDINKYLSSDKSLIDIGAGNGYLLSLIHVTKRISAVEPWGRKRAYLNKKFSGIKTHENIENLREKFDVVTAIHVLHHIKNKREHFIDKLMSLTKESGILIIMDMRKDLIFHKYFNRIHDFFSTFSLINEMDDRELLEILSKNGFEIKKHLRFEVGPYAHYYITAQKIR